jgi:hypothetical protein
VFFCDGDKREGGTERENDREREREGEGKMRKLYTIKH